MDLFVGSGTTAYEAEELKRNFIGVDISSEMIEHVQSNLDKHHDHFYELILGDSAKKDTQKKIQSILDKHQKESVELAILHPPYFDIIQFTEDKNDLSNAKTLSEFLQMFSRAVKTATSVLKDKRYLGVVIGDAYKNSEWLPLGFYCMNEVQKQGFKVKSIIVKNITNNRGKQKTDFRRNKKTPFAFIPFSLFLLILS